MRETVNEKSVLQVGKEILGWNVKLPLAIGESGVFIGKGHL